MKNLKKISITVLGALAISCATVAGAFQLDVVLGQDILDHDDSINFAYEISSGTFPNIEIEKNSFMGIKIPFISQFFESFNQGHAAIDPINSGDIRSVITLGYRNKKRVNTYPISCTDIPLKSVNRVTLTEDYCIVE